MKIVLVTGGFDPLHSGHIEYFKSAKKLGDELWVGLNSDDWLVKKKGKAFKPLELIWSKFPRYSRKNTLHVDDVEANFGFNPKNGIKCSCWRSDQVGDCELLKIAHYLKLVALSGKDMAEFNDNNMNWLKVMNEELIKQSQQNIDKDKNANKRDAT